MIQQCWPPHIRSGQHSYPSYPNWQMGCFLTDLFIICPTVYRKAICTALPHSNGGFRKIIQKGCFHIYAYPKHRFLESICTRCFVVLAMCVAVSTIAAIIAVHTCTIMTCGLMALRTAASAGSYHIAVIKIYQIGLCFLVVARHHNIPSFPIGSVFYISCR